MQKDRDKDEEEDTLGFTFYNKESKRKDGGKENVCDHEDNAKIILEKVAERDQKG